MGKLSKKFVPPLKPSQTINVDQNNNISKTHQQGKVGRKKLVISFDYAKMKKQHNDRKQIKNSSKSEVASQEEHCAGCNEDDVTSNEFMWFEPMQANNTAVNDESKDAGKSICHLIFWSEFLTFSANNIELIS